MINGGKWYVLGGFLGAIVVGVLLSVSGVAHAKDRCAATKMECITALAADLLECHSDAEEAGKAVDQACLRKVRDKFGSGSPEMRRR